MKYGKKNHINLNPLSYNIMLLGESKVGKTSVMKKVCEQLAGDEGYLFLELGKERGADAIEGINYVNCPKWDMEYDEVTNSIGFADICDDIIENKLSDYADLQAVVIDTYDQLITMAEDKSISLYNRSHPDKSCDSINGAWGGFGRGEKYAISLMLDKMEELKQVGVSVIIIGHVKTKDVPDVVSGESYQILTSDQQQNYFNAIKKNMHIIGLAYIDREIAREKTGKKIKDANGKQVDEFVSKVSGESRKIKFRDDSYCVDCGGRFADIVSEIDLDADAFIKAITDAILAEQKKSGMSLDESKKIQKKAEKAMNDKIATDIKTKQDKNSISDIMTKVVAIIRSDESGNAMNTCGAFCAEHGYENPGKINKVEDAEALLEILSK